MQNSQIGELLISNKLITPDQLMHAVEHQAQHPGLPLGQLLCQLGYLKEQDLAYILDANQKRQKLGEILVARQLIDEDKLDNALAYARKKRLPLGKALMKLNYIEEEQLAQAIARQYDLPFFPLGEFRLDVTLANLVNSRYARRNRLAPVRLEGRTVTIAMSYPLSMDEITSLGNACECIVNPVIARESDIQIAQHTLYNIPGTVSRDELNLEISEDSARDSGKSKYISDFISADVDFLVKMILTTGIQRGASDIHLETTEHGMQARYRIDGLLQAVDLGGNTAQISTHARQIVSKVKVLSDMDIAEKRRPQDSSFRMKVTRESVVRNVDFRVSTVPTQFGENVVIRILDKRGSTITLEGLGYLPDQIDSLRHALEKQTGIFLVTGPTGSGKSSALYALLAWLNSPGTKTMSIEDPIEYSMDNVTQTEVNDAIGNSFACLLRAFLRQDPDTIMVGEIRDLETATIAMRAALTGHTVLSTLHTNDATSAVTRLLDMGLESGLITTTLRGVMAQRLVRRSCDKCRVLTPPRPELLAALSLSLDDGHQFMQGHGCDACNFTGYRGRLPIAEIWIPTREELLLISRRPDNIALRNAVFAKGRRLSMLDDGIRRAIAGDTTLEELVRVIPSEQSPDGSSTAASAAISPQGS